MTTPTLRWTSRAALRAAPLLLTAVAAATLAACGGGGGGGLFGGDDEVYADMYNGIGSTDTIPLRGRLVYEDESPPTDNLDTNAFAQISQDELKNTSADVVLIDAAGTQYDLGASPTDDEGYFDLALDASSLGLTPGSYTLEVYHEMQKVGSSTVRLLDDTYDDVIVRSDVDQTYLNTDFMSSTGKLDLMRAPATERDELPGMDEAYKALRAGDDGQRQRPISFLSGSPRFFKRVLEGKMAIDGVPQDGLILKPFKDIVASDLADLNLDAIFEDLEEQIGYKITALLGLRLQVPPTTRELLMGDDTEADVVIYVLYHRFTSGELDVDGLMAELDALSVAPFWKDQIATLAPQVATHMEGHPGPVQAIYINRTGRSGEEAFPVEDWIIDGLVVYHTGAWPFILDQLEEDRVSLDGVDAVRARLEELGATSDDLDALAAEAVAAGWLDQTTVDAAAP